MHPSARRAVDFLIPDKCGLCRRRCTGGFCLDCQALLPWRGCACDICAVGTAQPGVCGRCRNHPPFYSESTVPFRYEPPISDLVQGLKYSAQLGNATPLSKMLSAQIIKRGAPPPDFILPTPLHRRRIMSRGFNQAAVLCGLLSRQLRVPVRYNACERVKNTPTQTGLGEARRRDNVKNAFRARPWVRGARVALVDDVITSGATCNAVARALVRAGAEQVVVWAVAKT